MIPAALRSRWLRLIARSTTPLDAAPLTRGERVALIAAVTILVVFRLPQAWLQGRFVGEEGTIFFAYAWHRPAADALWRSFAGYLNLGANGTTLLAARAVSAGIVPLERVPYLTMLLAFAAQLVPAILLVTGRARWLANRAVIAASLFVLVASPMTEEVFVNVLHIQFHLALATALILTLDVPRSRLGRLAYLIPLILAPLCGPGAIIVLPLFVVRALVDRDPGRAVQTATFLAGTAAQLLLFFHPSPVRGQFLSPEVIAAILFVRLFALPLFTSFAANAVGRAIWFSRLPDGVPWWWITVAMATAYFGWLILSGWRDRRDEALWLILGALALGVVAFGGGMIVSDQREWFSVGAGERYNFLPLVLLSWALIALAARPRQGRRRGPIVLVALTLLSGAITYAMPLSELSQGPRWSHEVARWRQDHDHPLATWPGNWFVDLSDRSRPCPDPALHLARRGDPTYCESAWLARVRDAVARRASEKN